jgi:hypothetical protein
LLTSFLPTTITTSQGAEQCPTLPDTLIAAFLQHGLVPAAAASAPTSSSRSAGAEEAKGKEKQEEKKEEKSTWACWAAPAFLLLDLMAQPTPPPKPKTKAKAKEGKGEEATAMAVDDEEEEGNKKMPAPSSKPAAAAAEKKEEEQEEDKAAAAPAEADARPLLTAGQLQKCMAIILPVLQQAGGAVPDGALAQAVLQLTARCVALHSGSWVVCHLPCGAWLAHLAHLLLDFHLLQWHSSSPTCCCSSVPTHIHSLIHSFTPPTPQTKQTKNNQPNKQTVS